METALFSLAVITAIAFVGPFLTTFVPGHWVQASAVTLLLGAVAGPNLLGLVDPDAIGLPLLKQLGLAFMFLMGGFEFQFSSVTGRTGRHAVASWCISLLLALAVSWLLLRGDVQRAIVAFAISLTSTSYGKVTGVLKERNLLQTRFGRVAASYGATGELLPVVAIAILLSDRAPVVELAVMGTLALVALGVAKLADHESARHTRLDRFVHEGSEGSQMMLQLVVLVLVGMVALGVVLGADMLVSGFAAGFILRRMIPDAHSKVITMVSAVANGFFIPVTLVLSGCAINLVEGFSESLVLLGFIALLVVVRGVPVDLGLRWFPGDDKLTARERIAVAAYSCTATSTVVAMTDIAVKAGDMTPHIASVLAFAASVTTILVPLVTRLIGRGKGAAAADGPTAAAGASSGTDD